MIEMKGDLFKVECEAFCVTTNGFVKKNGECVMGRGCAKQAANYWPELPGRLGWLIKKYGNNVHVVYDIPPGQLFNQNNKYILSFPVKPKSVVYDGTNCVGHMKHRFNIGDTVPGWSAVADMDLILRSAKQLLDMSDYFGWKKIVIPRPGCGAGELSWNEVKPKLDQILDNRFYSVGG